MTLHIIHSNKVEHLHDELCYSQKCLKLTAEDAEVRREN